MQSTVKNLPKGLVQLAITVPVESIKKELENAVNHISKDHPIDGYRPGKAPYDVVKGRFGEMAIYENALSDVVRKHYVAAVAQNQLTTYGQPDINITKLVPGTPIEFTATVGLVPKVTTLGDFRKVKVSSKPVTVDEKNVDATLKDLQKMQTKESRANREVREHDKVVVDMDLSLDKVPLEGGQARNHGIYLDEEYYVPGFKEQILGLKEGDKKNFTLKFPDTHYQKNIAGRDVEFAVTVKEVHELDHPPLDDAFAKTLGQESLDKVRELIRNNMKSEAEEKERQRVELEALEAVVNKSKLEEVPDIMVTTETERMLEELRDSLGQRGVAFDDYLKNIKKTIDELKNEFKPQAEKRVRTALVIREIGKRENIEVSDAELLAEVQKLMNSYAGNAEVQEQLRSEDYQDYLRTTLRNRKVVQMLRDSALGK